MAFVGDVILKGDNKWSIWVRKWLTAVGVPLLSAGLIYTADFMKVNPLPVAPEYVFLSGLIVTILYQFGNLLKHG